MPVLVNSLGTGVHERMRAPAKANAFQKGFIKCFQPTYSGLGSMEHHGCVSSQVPAAVGMPFLRPQEPHDERLPQPPGFRSSLTHDKPERISIVWKVMGYCVHDAQGINNVALSLVALVRDSPSGSAARYEALGCLDQTARCAYNLRDIEQASPTLALLKVCVCRKCALGLNES